LARLDKVVSECGTVTWYHRDRGTIYRRRRRRRVTRARLAAPRAACPRLWDQTDGRSVQWMWERRPARASPHKIGALLVVGGAKRRQRTAPNGWGTRGPLSFRRSILAERRNLL